MKTRFSRWLGTLLLAATLALPAAAQDAKVKLGQATPALSFLPIFAARALDTFKAEGLDLQWAAIAGGDPTTLAALDSGDIDFAAVGSETALQAIAKGQPFQMIYTLINKMSLELVVTDAVLQRTGVKPGDPLARRIAALKDATIGVSAVRGAQDRAARWLMAQGGLDPQRDLKVALIGPPPAIRAAFEKGAIDGFALSPPEGIIAERAGAGRILVRYGDDFPELKDFPFLVLVAKTPLSPEKEQLAIRTARALVKASERLLADPAAAAAEIHRRHFDKADPAVIRAAVESMAAGIAGKGRLSAAGIARLIAFASATGVSLDRTLDAAKGEGAFWTNAVIEKAAR